MSAITRRYVWRKYEMRIPGEDRGAMREDGQRDIGAGCRERDAACIGNGQAHQQYGGVAGALNCMHDQQAVIHSAKPPRRYIVRRLTPLECCRLQGFPDWWEDGADGSDSARYKMWGNGIALPCAADVLGRIAKEMMKDDQS